MNVSILIVPAAALAASLLTLISGFGLGTLLLPVFAVFFPLELAILLTALVHLLNNLFKLGLLWRHIHWSTVLRFGAPGILGAYLGARLMLTLGERAPLFQGVFHPVDPLDLVIAGLMLLFGLVELSNKLNSFSLPPKWMVPGGLISGFFGGLSGHQGALRSLFLLRSGLGRETFIATGVAIVCMVDLTRLPTYINTGLLSRLGEQWPLLLACTLASFLGVWWGSKLIRKVTMRGVQAVVGLLMLSIAAMLAGGLI